MADCPNCGAPGYRTGKEKLEQGAILEYHSECQHCGYFP